MAKGILAAVRVVLYLRMSSDKQELSIDQQRTELIKLTKRIGYKIVGEYIDLAISGDSTERRIGFLKMRDDAAQGKFDLVLCWDQDRFGRFDLIDAGHWIKPFRDAGVRLETIAQGSIDWQDLTGQLTYHANQLGKAQFLRDLSRNVCRGLLANARAAKGTGGNRIPYGYTVHRIFDERRKLIDYWLAVKPDEAEVVRLIFSLYLDTGGSLRGVAQELNNRNIPTPAISQGLKFKGKTSGKWNIGTIRGILKNRKHTGAYVWGKQGTGGYHTAATGEITKRNKHDRPIDGNPIIHEDKHEAIVDKGTFDRVQSLLLKRKRRTAPKKFRHYILSGLLRCGDCGSPMNGTKSSSKTGDQRYMCRQYQHSGKAGCYCNSIEEGALASTILRKIETLYLSDAALDRLRKAIVKEQQRQKQPTNTASVPQIRKRIEALDAKIERGSDRIFDVADELVARLMEKLDGLRQERDKLKADLRGIEQHETNGNGKDDSEVEAAIDALRSLRDTMRDADPIELAELLSSFVDHVELHFDHGTYGKIRRSTFRRGKVHLRPNLGCSHLSTTRRRCATG